jgi:hypothetical protein
MFRSSLALAGRTFLFCIIPSTSYWATFTKSLPPSPRRRFAMARPSCCGRSAARRAKAASGLRRTSRDESSAYTPKPLC